ncbi:hypothetical protein D3C73_1492020 [compost metagenome]
MKSWRHGSCHISARQELNAYAKLTEQGNLLFMALALQDGYRKVRYRLLQNTSRFIDDGIQGIS